MSEFQGYDQWKTASPYDDWDDEHCAYCKKELPINTSSLSDEDETSVFDGFCNTQCERNLRSLERDIVVKNLRSVKKRLDDE